MSQSSEASPLGAELGSTVSQSHPSVAREPISRADTAAEPSAAVEPPTLRYVAQQHKLGCQVATCAMLLGLTYEGALALYPREPGEHGFSHIYIDAILAERGFGVGRKYKHDCLRGQDRSPWPPEPWAPIHFAQVITGAGGHSVVLLGDGSVIDPAHPAPRRLADYQDVQWVAALVPPSSEASPLDAHPDASANLSGKDTQIPDNPPDQAEPSAAEQFVRQVSRLTHTGDDGCDFSDIEDAYQTLDSLIAKARDIMAQPLRQVLGAALSSQTPPSECERSEQSALATAELSRLQHSLALAVEALGPFAEFPVYDSRDAYQLTGRHNPDGAFKVVTAGDFRRAREVHSKLTGGG